MENRAALVSIIVPVYGTETYLPACIESICNQSHSHIQIILVDDGSPDGCPEICDQYGQKDSRILVIHQKNKGVSGARNTGLLHAAGDYVMFVDSDDLLYPDAVKTLLHDASEYCADVVSATKRGVDADGKTSRAFEDGKISVFQGEEPLILSLEGERNTNSACAKLFRMPFIEGIRFEEGKNIHEDGYFLFQCYLRKPVLVQHDVAVYQYNARPGSGSRQKFSDKYLSVLYFCDRKKELIAEHYPQHIERGHNMEVRANLQMLDLLCRTTEKKYKKVQKQCIATVRRLRQYHKPIGRHHEMMVKIVSRGLYPLYKLAVRLKYHR